MFEENNTISAQQNSAALRIIAQRIGDRLHVKDSDLEKALSYEKVQPGDLITAESMNKLLKRLAMLELLFEYTRKRDHSAAESFDVFGEELVTAVKLIKASDEDIRLGKVLDVNGMDVDFKEKAPGTRLRRVIGQFPVIDEDGGGVILHLLVTGTNALGGFRALTADVREMVADIASKVLNAQIDQRFGPNKKRSDSTNNTSSPTDTSTPSNTGSNKPIVEMRGPSIIADSPAGSAGDEGTGAKGSSAKARAGKKSARASKKQPG